MSDRLTLANAIEDAGIERGKAERIASVIFDVIHDNVATEADLQAVETRLNARINLIEHRLMTRLTGAAIVVAKVLFAALHYWPPHQ
jgi:hypothetical protein